MNRFPILLAVAVLIGSACATDVAAAEVPDFERQILPLLYNRCFSCHSEKADQPRADLRLDSVEGIEAGGVLVPGKPEESELLRRVSLPTSDESFMPPLKGGSLPLNETERDLLRRWIAAGAPTGAWRKFDHRQPATEFYGTKLGRADVPGLTRRVDELVEQYHAAKGTKLNPPVNDETFVRRVYLDVAGRIPSLVETTRFLDDATSDKRSQLIDALLNGEGHVSHTFNWKADQLRLITKSFPGQPGWMYDNWVKEAVRIQMPYDDFVRRLITAEGYLWDNGAVGFFLRDLGMPLDHMSNLSRLFLGTRIECAQCHDHPFEPITQKDFYQLTALTFGVSNMYTSAGYSTDNVKNWNALVAKLDAVDAPEAVRQNASGTVAPLKRLTKDTEHRLKFPNTYINNPTLHGKEAELQTPFGDAPAATSENRRQVFADWLTSPRNPRFSRNIANRLFKRVMGIGLIEPVDSLSPVNRPEQPKLLDFLTDTVARLGFDERAFLAVLFNSRLYQSESERSDPEPSVPFALRGPQLRRLSAEQVWDSMLTLLVEDLDERKPYRAEQLAELHRPWRRLAEMSADELLTQAQRLTVARVDLRRYTLEADEKKTELKKAQANGDAAAVGHLEAEIATAMAKADAARNIVQIQGPLPLRDTDPRWRGVPLPLMRASEIPLPIALGHFLRRFGQSDRREIDAFNKAANITHALALMNGELTERATDENSYLRSRLRAIEDESQRLRALYLSVLVRSPTSEEADRCRQLSSESASPEADIIWALLNSPEFLFVQ